MIANHSDDFTMSTIRFNLFMKFENILVQFHHTLEQASEQYKKIFDGLLEGKDMSKDMINDTCFFYIQEQRHLVQEEQRRISRVISGENNVFYTIGEINQKVGEKFELDIVALGQSCIEHYQEIERYTHAIEQYYRAKTTEYQSFFDDLYDISEHTQTIYDGHGSFNKGSDKQGMLIKTQV